MANETPAAAASPSDADALIDQSSALTYWTSIDSTVNGMLGGFPQISRIDLTSSRAFLAKLVRSSPHYQNPPSVSDGSQQQQQQQQQQPQKPFLVSRVADCGAGIGRITLGFLSHVAETVDIIEPVAKFTDQLQREPAFKTLQTAGRIGAIHNLPLQDWAPTPSTPYDVIWNQWCLGHLTSAQLVAYLARCRDALRPGGWVVVKENLVSGLSDDVFDDVDSSVTRSDDRFRDLFASAGLKVVATELQRGMPQGLYPVRTYALQPIAPEGGRPAAQEEDSASSS